MGGQPHRQPIRWAVNETAEGPEPHCGRFIPQVFILLLFVCKKFFLFTGTVPRNDKRLVDSLVNG